MKTLDSLDPASAGTVLIADDERVQVRLIERWLVQRGYQVLCAEDGRQCLDLIHRVIPDVILLDIKMPQMDGIEALERLKALVPQVPVIMLTADDTIERVVQAMQLGAYDYMHKPCQLQKLLTVLAHAVDKHRMAQRIMALERASGQRRYPELISDSPRMEAVFAQLDRLVHSDVSVLIRGESGTGKELVARAIHSHSGRASGPFVAVNCAAIPESLQESEFFGHERGAFTGAVSRQAGKLEQAHGGTLFLDEIAEMPLGLQAALLRAIQELRFTRVGGQAEVQVDVRLIAATHQGLLAQVQRGLFREDLYYRLAVFELELPPLRERPEDILVLAERFIHELTQARQEPAPRLDASARQALLAHAWPGNVRELRNAMRRALVVASGGVISALDLPSALSEASGQPSWPLASLRAPAGQEGGPPPPKAAAARPPDPRPAATALPSWNLEELERLAILGALEQTGQRVAPSAQLLGISRATLYRKLKRYGLQGLD